MRALHPTILVAPVLLVAAIATSTLHQPGDMASAYGSGGSAIYAAQVIGTTTPAHNPSTTGIQAGTDTIPLQPLQTRQLHQPSLAPHSAFDLRGRPSVSPALIDTVLASYGSPLAGDGKQIYQLGIKYGIDPAFCLAFFVHESAAGTRGEAVLTHSVGNIRAVAGAPSMDGYRYYDTWLESAEDWYRLISNLYIQKWGLTTVDSIIPVYAPSGDNNDPAAYIDDVEQLVSAWRTQS